MQKSGSAPSRSHFATCEKTCMKQLLISLALAVSACGPKTVGYSAPTSAPSSNDSTIAPPAPQAEPTIERPGYFWVKGRWEWHPAASQWNWLYGHWEKQRADQTWEPGHWDQHAGVWRWTEGHWRAKAE